MPATRRHLLTAALALPLVGCPKVFDPSAVLDCTLSGSRGGARMRWPCG